MAPKSLSSCNNISNEINFVDMAIGEYKEISAKGLSRYAVSNKDLIGSRHYASKSTLIIRAKQQGLSTIKIWQKDNTLREYNIFIHTKLHIAKARMKMVKFRAIGLQSSIVNSTITICGELRTLNNLEKYAKLVQEKKSKFEIDDQVLISADLQKELANLIYRNFLEKNITELFCKFDKIPIKCKLPKSNYDLNGLMEYSFSNIPIKLVITDQKLLLPNFKLKTHLLLLESANAEVLQLGLNQIASNIYSLLKKELNSFVGENIINFNNKAIKLSSIATPEILTRVNHKGEISIGSEIPFTKKSKDEYITNWKFAGLKIKTLIEKENNQFFLNIETELSRPTSNGSSSSISSNKTKSRVKLVLGESINVYDIGHHGIQSENNSLPYLSKIPILGKIFTSNSEIETYKSMKLFIQLEKQ